MEPSKINLKKCSNSNRSAVLASTKAKALHVVHNIVYTSTYVTKYTHIQLMYCFTNNHIYIVIALVVVATSVFVFSFRVFMKKCHSSEIF